MQFAVILIFQNQEYYSGVYLECDSLNHVCNLMLYFRDVFSVLREPVAFKALHDVFVEHVKNLSPPVQAIAALESRGFLFGPMLALEFGIPFIPIRKKGKLPGNIESISYELEYGKVSK